MGIAFRAATVGTAPVAGVTAGVYTFDPAAGNIILSNDTGQPAYVAFNGAATAAAYDIIVPTGDSKCLSADDLGVRTFDSIGVWLPAGAAATKLYVRGH